MTSHTAIPGGPWPPENHYPPALRKKGAIYGLGALGEVTDVNVSSYASALVAVDILQDIAPNAPELPGLLQRLDAWGAAVSAGTADDTEARAIEVGARTALVDALRRRELFSGITGAAIVSVVALGSWYAFKRKRKKR